MVWLNQSLRFCVLAMWFPQTRFFSVTVSVKTIMNKKNCVLNNRMASHVIVSFVYGTLPLIVVAKLILWIKDDAWCPCDHVPVDITWHFIVLLYISNLILISLVFAFDLFSSNWSKCNYMILFCPTTKLGLIFLTWVQ